ncbi:hypothetical protein METBIDRAFT_173101 [Metschnikowia bicuspidata var. bicuspidata NRRL YB-4993]|uniref:Uncharacterized protein n=1 Tax=Metschnikowia bicuspidata var. bicuspidata NRRL YB-4993 TaxID=869754 RepID=A0A1A0HAA3_9ASCO|nr:hypothetical protein METBIDRAFT_173101 [Metschnikowia bicuspidata var. bicuspidata NRRL YB-4993]OBA21059.1 hypothetical protein METBIDRAFT_173101 [Metschnikowia bicuspidata var. bicuspidata NRRL YB-4993]
MAESAKGRAVGRCWRLWSERWISRISGAEAKVVLSGNRREDTSRKEAGQRKPIRKRVQPTGPAPVPQRGPRWSPPGSEHRCERLSGGFVWNTDQLGRPSAFLAARRAAAMPCWVCRSRLAPGAGPDHSWVQEQAAPGTGTLHIRPNDYLFKNGSYRRRLVGGARGGSRRQRCLVLTLAL